MDNTQRNRAIFLFILCYMTLMISVYTHTGYDTYWHIKAGEWIINHLAVPDTGIFSFTKSDAPWTPHSWLSGVIIYGIYNSLGWPGLTMMSIMMVTISVLIMLKYLLEQLSPIRALCLMLMAYGLLFSHIMPRPHIIALPFMTYWFVLMLKASEQHRPPPIYNLLILILWTNIHGSFLIGMAYAVFFAFESVITAPGDIDRTQLTKKWGIFLILALFCLLITPHGLQGVLLPFQLADQKFAISRIGEWLSPNFQHFQFLEFWILLIIAFGLTQQAKLPVLRVIFLLGLIHLSLKHIRYGSDLMSLQAPLILAAPLANHWRKAGHQRREEFSLSLMIPVTNLGKALLVIIFCVWAFYIFAVKKIELNHSKKINEVLTVANKAGPLGNVFNSYDMGGFLIFNGFETFVDSRAELYRDDFIKAYQKAITLRGTETAMRELLQEYDIQWTLLSTRTFSIAYFNMDPEWINVYSNEFVVIHFRKDLLQEPAYQALKANLEELAIKDQEEKELKEQLENSEEEKNNPRFTLPSDEPRV